MRRHGHRTSRRPSPRHRLSAAWGDGTDAVLVLLAHPLIRSGRIVPALFRRLIGTPISIRGRADGPLDALLHRCEPLIRLRRRAGRRLDVDGREAQDGRMGSRARRPPAAAKRFNRVAVKAAGSKCFPIWATVEHRGRKSGQTYATPVRLRRLPPSRRISGCRGVQARIGSAICRRPAAGRCGGRVRHTT